MPKPAMTSLYEGRSTSLQESLLSCAAARRWCAGAGLHAMLLTAACWAGVSIDDLVAPGAEVEKVATGFAFTEGPAWSPEGFLLFTDLNQTYGKNQILVLDPDGRDIGSIPLPEGPSNCVFGGDDGKTLYITAWANVYRIRMKVRGAPLPQGPPPERPSDTRAERVPEGRILPTQEKSDREPAR